MKETSEKIKAGDGRCDNRTESITELGFRSLLATTAQGRVNSMMEIC